MEINTGQVLIRLLQAYQGLVMSCDYMGPLPLRLRYQADMTRASTARCPACGRICRLGRYGQLSRHRTPSEQARDFFAKTREEKILRAAKVVLQSRRAQARTNKG